MDTAFPLSAQRVRVLLGGAAEARVLVVGDCMLDRYVTGSTDRVSPEAPVPVVRVREDRARPGGAANVARGVAALGAACRLVGVVGDDEAGRELCDLLEEEGIGAGDLIVDPGRPTTVKTRILARGQQLLRVDRETDAPLPPGGADALRARAFDGLDSADVVILADYQKGTLGPEAGADLLERSRRGGTPSVVDPKARHFFSLPGATVCKPNGGELAAALGRRRPPRTEEDLRDVLRRLGCGSLLLTLGPEGMVLVEGEGSGVERIPARAREVYDVTGAGDTVTAALATFLAAGASLRDAARLANFAAGLQVGRLGAVAISGRELERAVADGGHSPEEGRP